MKLICVNFGIFLLHDPFSLIFSGTPMLTNMQATAISEPLQEVHHVQVSLTITIMYLYMHILTDVITCK